MTDASMLPEVWHFYFLSTVEAIQHFLLHSQLQIMALLLFVQSLLEVVNVVLVDCSKAFGSLFRSFRPAINHGLRGGD